MIDQTILKLPFQKVENWVFTLGNYFKSSVSSFTKFNDEALNYKLVSEGYLLWDTFYKAFKDYQRENPEKFHESLDISFQNANAVRLTYQNPRPHKKVHY